jgi:Protein of unknown function (DUF4199)
MENPGYTLLKSTMTYGAILGIFLALCDFLMFVFKVLPVGFLIQGTVIIITLASYYTGIYFSTKKIRTTIFSGNLTYRQGLTTGTLVATFAAVISEFYTYLQNTILDPNYMTRLVDAQKAWYMTLSDKIAQVRIDSIIKELDEGLKNYDALSYFYNNIFFYIFLGFGISLITSAYLKRKKASINVNEGSNSQI